MQDRDDALIRRRIVCRGVVQGVGFRPTVYRLGRALGLAGFVRNDDSGATIEVQGAAADVATFQAMLPQRLPPLARLEHVETVTLPPSLTPGFTVAVTEAERRGRSLVPPDTALCGRCRAELEDPRDRRHRHAFINCTDCGPRFSLVRSLPYDRERTAMACFWLCAECADEYADPASRRFHAEPICCPRCGPRLWLTDADGQPQAHDAAASAAARQRLADGAVLAVKGLGGFQLACRADRADAVTLLRRRKQRPRKPLAVMACDLDAARTIARLTDADLELLQGPIGPIVLAERCADAPLADGIAPGIRDIGVMLPTTALHLELFRDAPYDALVMTSGNRSDEPICLGNREAMQRLHGLADAFLLHDRDVVRRVDDSVVRATAAGPVLVRRSRGYAPAPLPLPVRTPGPLLAVGGHLQTTACVAIDDQAFVSQHIGDLDAEPARAFSREVIAGLEQFLDVAATTIVCDTHPDYASTWMAQELAERRGAELVMVPHHLAHAAAVLGEHLAFPAAGEGAAALVLDGTGHGPDGTAWGAELLWIDGALSWRRLAHGDALPLVGGPAAVREPWRVAAATLVGVGLGAALPALPLADLVTDRRLRAIRDLAAHPWPEAHGAGRLFEAAGALLGLCATNEYEGEAAARLEALAGDAPGHAGPWPEVRLPAGTAQLPQRALLAAAARRSLDGEPAAEIAAGLHATCAALWVELALRCRPGLDRIALGGGCLVNRLLLAELTARFADAGCAVLTAQALPPGDGGLAYGQCVTAAVALARGCRPRHLAAPLTGPRPEHRSEPEV